MKNHVRTLLVLSLVRCVASPVRAQPVVAMEVAFLNLLERTEKQDIVFVDLSKHGQPVDGHGWWP